MPVNKKPKTIRFIGGGNVGISKGSFPLATLFANSNKLTLHFGLDTYKFLPHQDRYVTWRQKRNTNQAHGKKLILQQ